MIRSVCFAQQFVESTSTTISAQATKELATGSFAYEFVEFPIDKLAKAITKKKNTVKVKIGEQINDTWTVQENEIRYDYLGINKWDDAGNPLPDKPTCETYLATSANPNLNIRFVINADSEISGFVHNLKTNVMTHFRSISMMTGFKERTLEKNKLAIYSEKFQTNSTQRARTNASYNMTSCGVRWITIAIETDDEFPPGNFGPVMEQVDYTIFINLGIRVYVKERLWTQGMAGYPYNGVGTINFSYTENGVSFNATRTSESDMFNRFIVSGWGKDQGCNMAHLLTGRKLRNYLAGNSGGYSNFSPTICGYLPLSMSSNEFSSIEQTARTIVHELGHNLAGETKHDDDPPYNTPCATTYVASNPTPNTLMCPFIVTGPNSGQGARGLYFSTPYRDDIISKIANNGGCLIYGSAPTLGQAYYNGVAINNTPFFANSRNGTMNINISSNNPDSNPSLGIVSHSPTSVFLGSTYVNGFHPDWVGGFSINAPNAVNNATFTLQTSNACGSSASKSILVVFGTAYRLYPNPARSVLTVELSFDKTTANAQDFLPESVTLLTDKNIEVKHSEPKKNYLSNSSGEANKFTWDLTGLDSGTYFVHITYGDVIFKEQILIQK